MLCCGVAVAERVYGGQVGGGLAAGIALLGAGFAAYKHHEKSEEEKKAFIWGAQNWLQEAQQRTQRYHQQGPSGPVTWVRFSPCMRDHSP